MTKSSLDLDSDVGGQCRTGSYGVPPGHWLCCFRLRRKRVELELKKILYYGCRSRYLELGLAGFS